MANLAVNCAASFGNLGSLCGTKNDFRMVTMLFLTTPDFVFDTPEDFADKVKWDEAIKAGKIFVLKGVQETDDNSIETVYYEAPSGAKTKMKNAIYSFLYKFLLTMEVHKELQKFDGQQLRYFKADSSGNILGWQDSSGKIMGFGIDNFSTENMMIPVSTETPALSPLNITEYDRNEWNLYGVYVKPAWLVSSLKSLAPVEIEIVGSPSATEIKVEVYYDAGLNDDGSKHKVLISGLELTDFALVTVTGTPQVISGATEAAGVYTLAGTALESGFLQLVEPTNLTEGLLIIDMEPTIITI